MRDRGRAVPRETFATVDEMLSREGLGSILGRPVTSVRRAPFTPDGSTTGATFEGIHIDGETRRLVAKTVDRGRDWVAIGTNDDVDREVRTWESGLLDRLPTPAAHAVLAGARSSTGYTILMEDLSEHLLPDLPGVPPAASQQELVIEAMASLHAEFWMDESLGDHTYGLAALSAFIGHTAPTTMERIRARTGPTGFTDRVIEGWLKLPSLTDAHLAEDLRVIADHPSLAAQAALRYPWTLVHSDARPANVAIDDRRRRVYLLDWARPTVAPPAVDLLYWLFTANTAIAAPREDLVGAYGATLERHIGSRFSGGWWEPQLDISYVAFVACFAPIIANVNPNAVKGWTDRCRPGLRGLG